jgi:hypothetical protein
MMRVIIVQSAVVLALFAWFGKSHKVNVLHIIIDDFQLHGDDMAGTTPNLHKFAESAVTFSRAYCQSPICTASRTSFLTGRRPDRFGLSTTPSFRDVPSSSEWSSLPGYFKSNNYTVVGLGKVWHEGSPAEWDGARSWSSPEKEGRSLLRGDFVAANIEYQYWPPSGSYGAATTNPEWTAQCAGSGPDTLGGRDQITGKLLPGSIGNPSCWADTAATSPILLPSTPPWSFREEERRREAINSSFHNETALVNEVNEDMLFYDGQLAERAVKLLEKLLGSGGSGGGGGSSINNSADGSLGWADGSLGEAEVPVAVAEAPPWYLAVGFHLPHTPWVVPRMDWERLSREPSQQALPRAQQVPPLGMPRIGACAGAGCLPALSFIGDRGQLVRLTSPQDFDPWHPLNEDAQAMLRGERGRGRTVMSHAWTWLAAFGCQDVASIITFSVLS